MRILGQLLIGVMLTVPSAQAAFGPWDLDIDGVAVARTLGHEFATRSDELALYVEIPSAQLRAVAKLPLMRELARTLGVWDMRRLLASAGPGSRSCRQRG